jgi:hypothetical protein
MCAFEANAALWVATPDAGRPTAHHVRFGSKADIAAYSINVRFTAKSGHSLRDEIT